MNCKNCQNSIETASKFCSNCGAQVVTKKITIKNILYDFSERYLSFDNKFLATFKTLFTHPEWVINGY
jgi:predicted amidophosphoribosyltransferase